MIKKYVKLLIILLLSTIVPCIAVFSVTNYITFSQYQKFASESEIDRLRAIDSVNSLLVSSIEQDALRFSMDPNLKPLGDFSELSQALQNIKYLHSMIRAGTMVSELTGTNNMYDSVYLYVEGSDYVISSRDSIVELSRFADTSWMNWYHDLKNGEPIGNMMPSRIMTAGFFDTGKFTSYDRKCLSYVYPIKRFTANFTGVLVFNIYEDQLFDLYQGKAPISNISIFSRNGTMLARVGHADYSMLSSSDKWKSLFDNDVPSEGYFFSQGKGKRNQYTYYCSATGPFVLLNVQDMDTLVQKTISYQLVFIVFLLLFIPFVALLVQYVSHRLYNPIGILVRELRANAKLNLGWENDEWQAITRVIKEFLSEEYRLFSDKGQEKLRSATFLRILSDDIVLDDEDRDVKNILPYENNICMLVLQNRQEELPDEGKNHEPRFRLLIKLIENGLSDSNMHPAVMRYEGASIVAIISMKSIPIELDDILNNKIKAIQQEVYSVMGYTPTFAFSSLTDDIGTIRQAFEQCKNAMQYRFIHGLDSILFYDRLFVKPEHYDADERLQYIAFCLKGLKKKEALEGIADLADDIKAKRNFPFMYVSQVLNRLVTIFVQYSVDQNIQLEELLGDDFLIYRQLWQNQTLDEAAAWFSSMFSKIIDYQNSQSVHGCEYVERVIEYVNQNYTSDITIDSIASHVGISYSYVRKLFKESTGQNLADYISDLRIAKAKKLICETKYTVKEIAVMCGFNHERSFSRAFTQSEGVSPGKYKQNPKEQEKTT